MNKKILALAFVSATFFFGCTADGDDNSSATAPSWDGMPSGSPSAPGIMPPPATPTTPIDPNIPGGSSYNYCIMDDDYDCYCYDMKTTTGLSDAVCVSAGGTLSNSCPSYCY